MIALLPLPFEVKATMPVFKPRVTPVTDGATGTLPVANVLDAVDAELLPRALVAMTVHV